MTPTPTPQPWSDESAFWQGWCDGTTGHSVLYDGYHDVMRAHGMDYNRSVIYFEGVDAAHHDGVQVTYPRIPWIARHAESSPND